MSMALFLCPFLVGKEAFTLTEYGTRQQQKQKYSKKGITTMRENRNNTDLLMEEGIMTIESFMAMMMDALSSHLEDCTMEAQEVKKNNGVVRHGISIKEPDNNVAPCIYLDDAFKAYQSGRSFDEIVTAVVENYEESRISDFDITMVRDFEQAKERLCFKVINSELNRELLSNVPHVPFCDLSVVFYLLIDNLPGQNGSVMVNNMFMADWGVDTETLFEIAKANTPRLLQGNVIPMKTIMENILGDRDDRGEELLPGENDCMYVATNVTKSNGAAVFLYDSMLSGFADSISRDFYIIPSSVHELIFLPDDLNINPEDIRSMISDVNSTCLEPQDLLSYNLYRYRRAIGLVELVA